jgi:hypothetical protein
MIKNILFFVILLLLVGCKSNFVKFQDQAIQFASNDKKIDEGEYNDLIAQIKKSKGKGFNQFYTSEKIDNSKVVFYLLKLFAAKKINVTTSDIWQPQSESLTSGKFNINVFLENSASMDGYVNGVTDFETAIYNLLGDIKISGNCDSLNLNYINKAIPYTKKNALAPDIQDFIEKLEPSTFKLKGGDRTVSDLKNILNTVLRTVDEKNTAILISDFVFSPGNKCDNKSINATDFLNNQSVGIKIDFAEKLSQLDMAVVLIQLESKFSGIYYDMYNCPISISCKRPYYVWLIGAERRIGELLKSKILDNIRGGYSNRLVFQTIKTTDNPDYKILYRPKIGDFDLVNGAKGLKNASLSTDGIFGFSVYADYSHSMQDLNYFSDSNNYHLSGKYVLQIERVIDNEIPGFTHKLSLRTTQLKTEPLQIEIIGKVPTWVYTSTSTDDTQILPNDEEKKRTFGFKYLVEGIADAFYPKTKSNVLSSINIEIKK